MGNLYSFSSSTKGAPKAVPASGSSISSNSSNFISLFSSSDTTIDVVNDFQWTTSPPGTSGRQEVPGIELVEKRLRTNSTIAAAAYYLMSGTSSLNSVATDLKNSSLVGNYATQLSNYLSSSLNGRNSSNVGSGLISILQNELEGAGYASDSQETESFLTSGQIDSLGSNYLDPYEGLYITENTGFKYWLPYFDDKIYGYSNSFEGEGDLTAGGLIGAAATKIRGAAEALARFAYFMEPGIYIERPHYYSFENSGEEVTVKFPLINTGWSTYEDVKKNWQFIFLLTYQNRPNRRTRELIDPVCLYEVNIPGVKYLPFAYFSRINVDCLGARRLMDLEVPTPNGTTTISTLVPDAYEVSLTLTSLIGTSRNFMAAALTDKQDIIDVGTSGSFNEFSEIWNNLQGII